MNELAKFLHGTLKVGIGCTGCQKEAVSQPTAEVTTESEKQSNRPWLPPGKSIGSRHCDPACTAGADFDDAIHPTAGRTTGRSSRSISCWDHPLQDP